MTRVAVRPLSMITVNIHEAKTQLSQLVDQAVKGEVTVLQADPTDVSDTPAAARRSTPTRRCAIRHYS